MNQDVAKQTYSAPSLPGRAILDIIDYCMSASERPAEEGGKLYLRNMPNQADRQVLAARARQVLEALKQHDNKEIAIAIVAMLGSYDVAQAKQITAAERRQATAVYVRELHGVPTWAVVQACDKIRMGTAPDISHQFKPTPIQVRVLAVDIAGPWKNEYRQIGEILGAPEYHEGASEEERQTVGGLVRKLAEDLKSGALREEGGGVYAADTAELEKERNEALLRRLGESSIKSIEREWIAMGEKPRAYSPSLARLFEEQDRKRAAAGPSQEDLGS